MIYLLQLLSMVKDLELFKKIFHNLKETAIELGFLEDETGELVNELLMSHFGIEVECPKQLEIVSGALKCNETTARACKIVKLKREV